MQQQLSTVVGKGAGGATALPPALLPLCIQCHSTGQVQRPAALCTPAAPGAAASAGAQTQEPACGVNPSSNQSTGVQTRESSLLLYVLLTVAGAALDAGVGRCALAHKVVGALHHQPAVAEVAAGGRAAGREGLQLQAARNSSAVAGRAGRRVAALAGW